ncbi:MAG: superoxide dismutase family protein [Gordonia sp. (in: high G+C Gram-positive bacteria)]
MTVSSQLGPTMLRRIATGSAVGVMTVLLAGCVADEHASSVPGTTPAVVTGEHAPSGAGAESHDAESSGSEEAVAELHDTEGASIGEATFASSGSAVVITLKVNGLPAGFHGVHIHENGVCSGDFTSAGGHLQVDGHSGHPSSGDLISLNVLPDGTGQTVTSTSAVTLSQISGKSLIIHAGPDNFGNIPTRYSAGGVSGPDEKTLSTGDAGERIGCGVITAEH